MFKDYFTGNIVEPTDVSFYKLTLNADTKLDWPTYLSAVENNAAPFSGIMQVSPTADGFKLYLPLATLGAEGDGTLIVNTGSYRFFVVSSSGSSLVFVNPGQSYYFYLTTNTTENNAWNSTLFGAGSSGVDVTGIAGNGLIALSGKIVSALIISLQSNSPIYPSELDRAKFIVWTGGSASMVLPPASSLSAGWYIYVRNQGNGSILVTTSDQNSLISGYTSVTFDVGSSGVIAFEQVSGNFYTVGSFTLQNTVLSSATYNVDAIQGNVFSLVRGAPVLQKYVALSGARTQTLAVTLPATTQLYSVINSTGSSQYSLTFALSGSAQTPVNVATGRQVLMISDGVALYVINQAVTGVPQLPDGTASSPALNFLSEPTTGFYKSGAYRPAISAGGVRIATFDGSDPNNLYIATPGTIICKKIVGGII